MEVRRVRVCLCAAEKRAHITFLRTCTRFTIRSSLMMHTLTLYNPLLKIWCAAFLFPLALVSQGFRDRDVDDQFDRTLWIN